MEGQENNTSSEVFQQKVDTFFKQNPKAKNVFVTADGFLFTDSKFAHKHAETLDVKEPKNYPNPTTITVDVTEENSELTAEQIAEAKAKVNIEGQQDETLIEKIKDLLT